MRRDLSLINIYVCMYVGSNTYVTEFAKRGLLRAIINIEKPRFEILKTVYLENA